MAVKRRLILTVIYRKGYSNKLSILVHRLRRVARVLEAARDYGRVKECLRRMLSRRVNYEYLNRQRC
jgi:hypothetical protein